MGNVSQRVPGLHPFVGIDGIHAAIHTRDFTAAADTDEGYRVMLDSALAMAWAIHSAATRPERRRRILEQATTLAARRADAAGSEER